MLASALAKCKVLMCQMYQNRTSAIRPRMLCYLYCSLVLVIGWAYTSRSAIWEHFNVRIQIQPFTVILITANCIFWIVRCPGQVRKSLQWSFFRLVMGKSLDRETRCGIVYVRNKATDLLERRAIALSSLVMPTALHF